MLIEAGAAALRALIAAGDTPDLCIIGAGAAGISMALALDGSRLRVLVLESGATRPDRVADALNRGEVVQPALHCAPQHYRRRGLGGATALWGGRCVPLDPIDFAARPWLGLEQPWPVSHAEMVPTWQRAQCLVQAGPYDYAAGDVAGGLPLILPALRSDDITMESVERFSPPTRFGTTYRPALAASRNVTVLTGLTCVEITLTEAGSAVRAVTLAARDGTRLVLHARAFVLATGGIEVPRLLLASHRQQSQGVGNQHGQVGRHYMCHLAGVTGSFTPAPGVAVARGYGRGADGVYCRRRFAVTPAAQARAGIGNAIVRLHHPDLADAAHRSATMSAIYLARFLLPYEYRLRLGGQGAIPAHMRNVARDPAAVLGFAGRMLRQRRLARRKYPSLMLDPPNGVFSLDVHAEQLPNPASRITLGHGTDRFAMPVARVDWRYLPADIETVRGTLDLLRQAIATCQQGALSFDRDQLEADLLRQGAYGGHHLGTARMALQPRDGVVDAQCRVHGLANLFIASGAVFPTSGQANPTLTIIALALRLSDHLARSLADGGALCPGLRAAPSPQAALTA